MKKIVKLVLILFLLLANVLTGCKADEGPDDKPIALEPAGNVIDRYKKDDTDYSSKPAEKTRIVRLH
ncbi:MAG: hypothetical protein IKE77_09345, partial [Erysipelotrichaceae bacterium]|nr:hypothetical protein [Erysipelotrichaceae bacterium]